MNVQKGKPSVSPPVQIATQPQHLSIASAPPTGHTPPLLRTDEIQIFQQPSYAQVPSYQVQQAPVPHDMNKQQPVAAGLMPAPGVAPQQQGIFQQQQAGLRTTQSPQYFPGSQPQGMRPPRYMGPQPQPNLTYQMYGPYMGQTQGQGYPAASVMVQQQGQLMYPPNTRMPSPQYHHAIPNSQTTIQQQMAATAQYQNPPTAQYGSAPQFQVYYQAKAPVPVDIPRHERGQTVPIAQPQRPTSASGVTQATHQKRVRNPIPIIDPNSGQQVQTEAEAAPKTTPPGGSARSTPVGQPAPESSPPPSGGDIAAQFAAQVAATLRSGHPPSSHTPQGQDMTASSPPLSDQQSYSQSPELAQPDFNQDVQETRPLQNEQAVEDMSSNAQIESGVDEPPQQVPVHEPSVKEATPPPETSETEVIGSSVDYAPEPSQVVDQSSPVDADSFTEPFRVDVENITPFVPAASQAPVQAPTPAAPIQAPTVAAPVQSPVPEPVQVAPVQPPVPVAVVQEPAQVAPPVVTPPVTEPKVTQPEVVEKADPPQAGTPAPTPAVVSVADMAKEQTPPPAATESKEVMLDNEPASAGNLTGKDAKQKGGKKKLRDLNRKGDEKEGTDMDAFLDAETAQSELQGDEVKDTPAQVEEVKTEVKIPPAEPVNNVADVGKENKMPNVEIEIKNSEESEVSRKNAKNEEKTNEVTTTEENSVEKKQALKYKYKEDQWSPLNPEGKMTYDREFLLQLQYSKDSMKKPDSLPNFPEIIPDKPPKQGMDMRGGGGGGGGYGHVPDFTPGFLRPSRGMGSGGGGGGGGGGSMGKRGSQQRNRSDVRVIKNVSIQLDVKLHHSENAWKPSTQKSEDEKKSDDDFKTSDLYRKVRSILNKLTPQKFQTLIKQVQNLVIDTEDRLKGVTDIIFEKAISEPAFSVAYANMCRYLLTLKVPSDSKQGETVNFRVILLTRCQREFEKDNDAQVDLDRRKKAIEEADSDSKRKEELKEELVIAATTARRRSIGNIRFIGELFKLKMLTENIMHDCVFKLLRSRDEENLECLCRLLTTIGKELESDKAKPRMDQYFQQMKKIVAEKKVSSRCRFMLQDVIELRDNNWKPRRGDDNPKTIDQIHKDAKREAVEQNMLTALHMANQQPQQHHQPRHNKPTRGRPGQGGGGGGGGGNMEEGWNTVSSKAIRNIDRNIDVSKLRIEKNADENIQLGPARSFGGWGRGSSGGGSRASKEGDKPNAPGNRFSALSREDDQRSRAFGRGVSPARGDGRNRANTPGGYNRGKVINRSSQESERERALASARSIVSGRATPPSGNTSREGSRTRSSQEVERPAPAMKELTEDEMEKKTYSIIDEYLHIQDRKEAIQCVQELNSPKTIHFFVYFAINHVLERSKQARQQTGHLLHDLINQKIISVDTYLQGLTEILQSAEDMEIDIPKIWQYLGELIGPMIQDGSVPLSFLKKACEPLKPSGKAGNLMAEILHDASQRLGHKIVTHLWRNNCMDWSFFVPQEKIQQFLKEKNLEFTVGPDSAPSTPTSKVSIEWIKQNLSELLLKPKCDNEQIFDWIEANVPDEITKENRFIRALMTTVCSSAIVGTGNMTKVDQEPIKKWRSLLQKYLDHQPVFELQALYALQALVHSLEYPSGVLRTFFDTLYDEEIISEDAFNQWETSKEEQEGKGVALKQVVQFFAWLREGEEEEADS